VPCFNEAARLDSASFKLLADMPNLHLLLVDDGSTDGTGDRLLTLQQDSPLAISVQPLANNLGKAEAVRRGMLQAMASGADIVGYLDADFATPASEMLTLVAKIESDDNIAALLGSRWLHLGADIKRSAFRHYAGRVFATLAANMLALPVYDTQCGAKLFRVSRLLKAALEMPFASNWAFDVELIGRLRYGFGAHKGLPLAAFYEQPLATWSDVDGSKLRPLQIVRTLFEMLIIRRRIQRLKNS
jgi:dolichyl-phosphate beta-glucosyltransferase